MADSESEIQSETEVQSESRSATGAGVPVKRNSITGIIAPKASGKTTLALRLIESQDRVVIFDVNMESAYALKAEEIAFGNPARLAAEMQQGKFRIAYRTLYPEQGFEEVAKLVYLRGNTLFVIEEVDLICKPNYTSEMLKVLIHSGRHREVSIIYLCRRFATISRTLTASTDTIAFFRMTEPIDLQAIRDRCGTEAAESVSNLRKLNLDTNPPTPGQCLIWRDTGEMEIQEQ